MIDGLRYAIVEHGVGVKLHLTEEGDKADGDMSGYCQLTILVLLSGGARSVPDPMHALANVVSSLSSTSRSWSVRLRFLPPGRPALLDML
jgi:hypothetical protein